MGGGTVLLRGGPHPAVRSQTNVGWRWGQLGRTTVIAEAPPGADEASAQRLQDGRTPPTRVVDRVGEQRGGKGETRAEGEARVLGLTRLGGCGTGGRRVLQPCKQATGLCSHGAPALSVRSGCPERTFPPRIATTGEAKGGGGVVLAALVEVGCGLCPRPQRSPKIDPAVPCQVRVGGGGGGGGRLGRPFCQVQNLERRRPFLPSRCFFSRARVVQRPRSVCCSAGELCDAPSQLCHCCQGRRPSCSMQPDQVTIKVVRSRIQIGVEWCVAEHPGLRSACRDVQGGRGK
ncbi:hypothetical protein QBC47DRAFT_178346 [Echria macrotheca]|uniref:Uncharacterized protein n=1 Tax=Echria macrotheca TaxID=438768 RepID=A0AAJ0BD16_9PEZI|nr:hypothetical protein QBC47DRAFT_178346 [Echria macrotheca]